MMRAGIRRAVIDGAFLTLLFVIAGLPLVVWRGTPGSLRGIPWIGYGPSLLDSTNVAIFWPLFALAGSGWLFFTRRWPVPPEGTGESVPPLSLWRPCLAGLLIFVVGWLAFYEPMRLNFWGGGDEFVALNPGFASVWSDIWDRTGNRPTLGWVLALARRLTPDQIEGFLWVSAALCFLNGLILWRIASETLPSAERPVAVAAGLLLVINRADTSRFYVIWTTLLYWGALFLLLAAAWLFLFSYRRGQRWLLLISCIVAGCALLASEGLFPLAALVLVLLWSQRRDRSNLVTWAYGWTGMIAVLAMRFVGFVLATGATGYQAKQSAAVRANPWKLAVSLEGHIASVGTYFQPPDHWMHFRFLWLGTALAAVLAVWLMRSASTSKETNRWRLYAGIIFGAILVLAGSLPFLHIPGDFRTEFFAAPGQAILVACSVSALTRWLGPRAGTAVLAATVGILAGNSAVRSLDAQLSNPSQIRFEKVCHVFQQIHALSPRISAETLLLFVLDDPKESPLGDVNYPTYCTARILLGPSAAQTSTEDAAGETVTFSTTQVDLHRGDITPRAYDQVVAFQLHTDGTLELLEQLPAGLTPERSKDHDYNPLALLKPGAITPLPYLRKPSWMAPVEDILSESDGFVLTGGWSAPVYDGHSVYRQARPDAGLLLNSMGQRSREITLDVEGPKGADAYELQVRSAGNEQPVATVSITGRSRVHLTLPTKPNSLGFFHLRLVNPEQSSHPLGLRVYGPERAAGYRQDSIFVASRGVHEGDGWYPAESDHGTPFRWLGERAGLTVERTPAEPAGRPLCLAVELLPGPGVTKASLLQLTDADGNCLSSAPVPEARGRVLLPIPEGHGKALQLHVKDGGRRAPLQIDPRILNVRVFRLELAPEGENPTVTPTAARAVPALPTSFVPHRHE